MRTREQRELARAYQQGYQAGKTGAARWCPYAAGTAEFERWQVGYLGGTCSRVNGPRAVARGRKGV